VIPEVPAPWPRPRYRPAGAARFAYVLLLPEAVEITQRDHPLFAGMKLETRTRDEAPEWFAGWTDPKGTYGSMLLRTPGVDIPALGSCREAMILSGVVDDPRDLGYLQRAFLVMKLLTRAGAVAACDVESLVWWTRTQLEELPADWELDVSDHLRVVFEATEREPGAGHLCHTLGMAKFGRPDLAIGGMERQHAEAAGEMLEALATAMAEGDAFEDGDVVEPAGFPALACTEVDDDAGSPDAIFGNRSIWLTPE
jgi:hypothetical protein